MRKLHPKKGRPPRAGKPAEERVEIRTTRAERRAWKTAAGTRPLTAWLRDLANASSAKEFQLPRKLRHLFWDVEFKNVSWKKHFGYIVNRLLSVGGPKTVSWLRKKAGDAAIRKAIMSCKARGLSSEQIAPWISKQQYELWISKDPNRAIWVP